MFARESKSKNPRIETLVAKSVRVHGDFDFSGGLHLDGRIAGNVRAPKDSGSTLSVSEHGCIEGAVEVPTVVLNGRGQRRHPRLRAAGAGRAGQRPGAT